MLKIIFVVKLTAQNWPY